METPGGEKVARGLTVAGALTAALAYPVAASGGPMTLGLLSAALVGSAALSQGRSLGSQVIARAIWWQTLLLGTLMAIFGNSTEEVTGLMMAVGTAVALSAAGRRGLDARSPSFAPVAFRRTMMLAMVMALADMQSLFFYGMVKAELTSSILPWWPLFACGALMAGALYGLFRLKVWGLLLNIAANLFVVGVVVFGKMDLHWALLASLSTTALIQLLLPLPLLRELFKGAQRGGLEGDEERAGLEGFDELEDADEEVSMMPEVEQVEAVAPAR